MAWTIDGHRYYGTAEACSVAGISKDTLLRWVRTGQFEDVKFRDRHGWRLFTDDDLSRLKAKVNHLYVGR
jgi:predicted site-specific integrase-resolvase